MLRAPAHLAELQKTVTLILKMGMQPALARAQVQDV